MKRLAYSARWVFPGNRAPLQQGVVITHERRIEQVLTSEDWNALADPIEVVDLGETALLPAFINAHTHLEFSQLSEPLEPLHQFAHWIRSVVRWRGQRADPLAPAIRQGLQESFQSGSVAIGEIATHDGCLEYLDFLETPAGSNIVLFRELLGLREEAVATQLNIGRRHLQSSESKGIRPGLSPHAPYSVHPQLLEGAVNLCREFDAPLAMHVAESREELELLQYGTGPLVGMLQDFGVWRPEVFAAKRTFLDVLRVVVQAPRVLIIHGNYLNDAEQNFIADNPHMTVVYCPRTHAVMRHAPHPWRDMQAKGIRIALGTDSRASNPNLSIFDELKFLHRQFPDVPVHELVQLATVHGAAALGFEGQLGAMEPGLPAQFLVLQPIASGGLFRLEDVLSDEARLHGRVFEPA